MITRLFVFCNDPDSGFEGWRPKDLVDFNPGNQYLVAHDTMEHFANDTGTLADEIRALGAFAFVRIDSGYAFKNTIFSNRDMILARVIASTIADDIRDRDSCDLADAPGTLPLNPARYGHAKDQMMQRAIQLAIPMLTNEWDLGNSEFAEEFNSPEFAANLLGWLRIGYRAAHRRYRGDANLAGHLMQSTCEKVAKLKTQHNLAYGDEMRVSISVARMEVSVKFSPENEERLH